MADALFPLDPAQVRMDDLQDLSAQQRLTVRQAARLAQGLHPLSLVCGHIPLHAEAAPADNRSAAGRRCNGCVFHQSWGAHSYPKCSFGNGVRRSHGAATDCRGWWPGCRDHQHESDAVR